MRMIDLDRKNDTTYLSLLVTREEAQRFARTLRALMNSESATVEFVTLEDNGDGTGSEPYKMRRIRIAKVVEDEPESQGWPDAVCGYLKGREALSPSALASIQHILESVP